ncbi:MDR family MFS transporter [Thalassotalea fusca]
MSRRQQLKSFPALMWVLIFGAFITRGSYYMVWPFLAIILYDSFQLSATSVGVILSAAALVSVFVGFVGGTLSDKYGRKNIMYASGILYIISFIALAEVTSLTGYVVIITLCSIAKAIWEPPTSALIGDIVKDEDARELAMQIRYFSVNVGAALGPMGGVWLGLTGQQSSFVITAYAFLLFLVVLAWGFKQQAGLNNIELESTANSDLTVDNNQKQGHFSVVWQVLKQDRLLQCLILANMTCMLIYAQMDTTLVQYLKRADAPDVLLLVSSLILTNALVIVCFQFILLKVMASLTLVKRIQIALAVLAISQVWLAFNPLTWFWGWVGAIVLMSLAEAVLFPTMNVHIDRIAPKHLRGAYFGAASFYSVGYAIAPFIGGVLLDSVGVWLFLIGAAGCLWVIYLYSILDKLPRPEIALNTASIDKA